jgi:hypothetical protein
MSQSAVLICEKRQLALPPSKNGGRYYSWVCKMARLAGSKGKEMGGLEPVDY